MQGKPRYLKKMSLNLGLYVLMTGKRYINIMIDAIQHYQEMLLGLFDEFDSFTKVINSIVSKINIYNVFTERIDRDLKKGSYNYNNSKDSRGESFAHRLGYSWSCTYNCFWNHRNYFF